MSHSSDSIGANWKAFHPSPPATADADGWITSGPEYPRFGAWVLRLWLKTTTGKVPPYKTIPPRLCELSQRVTRAIVQSQGHADHARTSVELVLLCWGAETFNDDMNEFAEVGCLPI